MKRSIRWAMVSLALVYAQPVFALRPGERVDNFSLLDQHGNAHELYYLSDASAVVLMVYGNGCPIVQRTLPALKRLREQYRDKGVVFLLVDANLQDSRDELVETAAEFAVDFPILLDPTQLIAESLGFSRTAEVLLIDPKHWALRYRGPLDDRIGYGVQRVTATKPYLVAALEDLLAGRPVERALVETRGCLVHLPQYERRAAHAKISYAAEVAPLLATKCGSCHRRGGGASWAMSSYEKVRGFAPMIREVVRTARMPPWHADPHYGSFAGDRSLTLEEARLLVHWVEAGALRGEGADPLPKLQPQPSEWTLGRPDRILELPAYDVPASGVIDYQYPGLANPLGRDAWLCAVEVQPGDRSVVHHVLAGLDDPAHGARRALRGQLGELGGYAPGKPAMRYPEHTGIFVPEQAGFRFQMHYTTNGKPARVVTRLGLYLCAEPPRHALQLALVFDTSLSIPANAKAHRVRVDHEFSRDIVLYGLMPHAHLRGRAARFVATYPDGRDEILLSVPRYDFNWQTAYALSPPKPLPAGTRITFDMTWDNSAQNPANPDASRTVYWGEQTWEEMNVGWIRYRDATPGELAVQ